MKKIIFILLVAIAIINCNSVNYDTKKEPIANVGDTILFLSDFNKIMLLSSCDIVVTQVANKNFSAKLEKKYLKNFDIYVKNKTLYIKQNNKKLKAKNNHEQVKIDINAGILSELTIQSSGNIYQKGDWDFPDLTLNVFGSGDFVLENIKTKNFVYLNTTGSGDISIKQLQTLKLNNIISGSGDISITKITHCQDIKTKIAGSGDIQINSQDTIDVNKIKVVGSGNCKFEEMPSYAAYVNITGSGDVYVNSISLLEANIIGSGDIYFS